MKYTEESMFGIKGEVAIITGAGSGLGYEIAFAMAKLGAKTVLVDVDEEKLGEKAGIIQKEGCVAVGMKVDVAKKDQVQDMAKRVFSEYGKIDILVNSAGIVHLQDAVDFEEEIWDKVMAVNIKGTMLACQAVGRYMVEKGKGRIVNISSVRGMQGRAKDLAYAPSKGAVDQLTRSLAIEWAKHGVNVNSVAPAFTLTDISREILADKNTMDSVLGRFPMGRLGEPGDITGPVIFLCGESAGFITGQVLYVDGGWTCA